MLNLLLPSKKRQDEVIKPAGWSINLWQVNPLLIAVIKMLIENYVWHYRISGVRRNVTINCKQKQQNMKMA